MADKIKRDADLAADLKAAIEASGLTTYALAKASDVPLISISRFLRGERSLSLDSAGRIAAVLDLELKKRQS